MSNKTHAKKSRSKQKVSSARVRKRTRKGYRQLKKSRRAASSTPSSSFSNLRISLILILFSAQCVTPLMINRNSRAFLTDSSDSSKSDSSPSQNVFNSGPSSPDSSARSTDLLLSNAYNSESDLAGLFRVRRNPGAQFSDVVQNLQRLARISSGIALEVGLIDGTISPDDAITELLRMGDLKPQDIIGLDQKTVDSALDELTKLPKDAPAAGVAETESRLVILENIREKSSEFLDFSVIPGKEDYETSLNKVKELVGLEGDVRKLQSENSLLKTNIKTLKDIEKIDDSNYKRFASQVETIAHIMQSLSNLIKSFDNVVSLLKEAKKIQGKSDFLYLLISEQTFRAQISVSFTYADAHLDSVTKSIQNVYDGSKTMVGSVKSFQSIRELVDSRSRTHRQSFTITSGLPSGNLDLGKLKGDCESGLIKDRVSNSTFVVSSLKKAFSSFDGLAMSLNTVNSKWESLSTDINQKSVNQVIDTVLKVTNLPEDSEMVIGNAKQLKECDEKVKNYPSHGLVALQSLHQAMNTLSQKLTESSDFGYLNQFKNLETIKTSFNLGTTDEEKKAQGPAFLTKLKSDETLKTLVEQLGVLDGDLTNLISFTSNTKLISDIDLSKATGPTDANYLGFFKCLNDIQVEKSPVKHTLELIQNLRSFNVAPDAEKIINGIVSSGDSVKSVVSTAADLKKVDSREAKGLGVSVEKSYLELSKKLGLAVQGLSAIALFQSTNLTPLLSKTSDFQQDAATLGLAPDHQKNLGELFKIPGVQKEVNEFLNSFQGQLRRKRQNPTQNFKSFESIFQQASGLKGASIDLKRVRMALEILNLAAKNKYAPELSALEKLEKLDLDFTRFNIGDAIPTLSAMDDFFLKYTKEMSKPVKIAPAVPPAQGSPPASPSVSAPPGLGSSSPSPSKLTSNSNTTTEKSDFMKIMNPIGFIICGFAGLAAIILGIVLYCCHCCCSCCYKIEQDDYDWEKQDKKRRKRDSDTDSHSSEEKDKVKKEGKEKDKAPPKPGDDLKKDGPNNEPPKGDGADPLPTTTPKVEKPFELAKTQEETPPPAPPPKKMEQNDIFFLARSACSAIKSRIKTGMSPQEWALRLLTLQTTMEKQLIQDEDKEHVSQRRYKTYYCKKETMAKIAGFKDDKFININEMSFGNKLILMGQGALDPSETYTKDKKEVPVRDTRAKQWACMDENNVGLIVQLCQTVEEGFLKCADYYSKEKNGQVEYGDYVITTTDVKTNLDMFTEKEKFTLYSLEYKLKTGDLVKKLDVLLFTGWPDKGAPKTPEPVIEMLRLMDTYESNIFVHCSAGIGRTGTLVAVKYGIELCQREKVESPTEIIQDMRKFRQGAIQSQEQVLYMVLCITKGLMDVLNVEFLPEYEQLLWYHQKTLDGVYMTAADKEHKKNENKKRREMKPDELAEFQKILDKDDLDMEAEVQRKKKEHEAKVAQKKLAEQNAALGGQDKKDPVAQDKKNDAVKAKTGDVAQDKASQEKGTQDKKDQVAQDKKDKKSKVDKIKTVDSAQDKLTKDKKEPDAQDNKKTSEVPRMLKEYGKDKVPRKVAQFRENLEKKSKEKK